MPLTTASKGLTPQPSHLHNPCLPVYQGKEQICQYGVPESVHSDQGPNFESRLFTELCKTCQISKIRHLDIGKGYCPYVKGRFSVQDATGLEIRVPSDIFPPNNDEAANNAEVILQPTQPEERLSRRRLSANLQASCPICNTPQVPSPKEQGPISSNESVPTYNAQLHTQPVTLHHNRMRPYKGTPPVGYEDEVYVLTEDMKPLHGNFGRSS
ncbi:hypothetical protein EGR_03886 [Echinococcus granulosus]|uniref:Integrase catalytic domain-containing protein n=1 Tax=Echinococcus granulosus TaxID=6210 RepID=W6UJ88_ECHGR|nr:hypothetical protein EGR_03886 [Echinococcus granulosus]EUB61211.1 hypothetical protein EGR_03886 [Echinococcus granulosus]